MYLQLAENGYTPPSVYMADPGRLVRVRGYRVPSHLRRLSEEAQDMNPYVYLPAHIMGTDKGMMVREDYFDALNDEEWKGLMWQLAPFQAPVESGMSEGHFLSGLFKSRAERKEKREVKTDKKKANVELKL